MLEVSGFLSSWSQSHAALIVEEFQHGFALRTAPEVGAGDGEGLEAPSHPTQPSPPTSHTTSHPSNSTHYPQPNPTNQPTTTNHPTQPPNQPHHPTTQLIPPHPVPQAPHSGRVFFFATERDSETRRWTSALRNVLAPQPQTLEEFLGDADAAAAVVGRRGGTRGGGLGGWSWGDFSWLRSGWIMICLISRVDFEWFMVT